jgi:hypothetical protein
MNIEEIVFLTKKLKKVGGSELNEDLLDFFELGCTYSIRDANGANKFTGIVNYKSIQFVEIDFGDFWIKLDNEFNRSDYKYPSNEMMDEPEFGDEEFIKENTSNIYDELSQASVSEIFYLTLQGKKDAVRATLQENNVGTTKIAFFLLEDDSTVQLDYTSGISLESKGIIRFARNSTTSAEQAKPKKVVEDNFTLSSINISGKDQINRLFDIYDVLKREEYLVLERVKENLYLLIKDSESESVHFNRFLIPIIKKPDTTSNSDLNLHISDTKSITKISYERDLLRTLQPFMYSSHENNYLNTPEQFLFVFSNSTNSYLTQHGKLKDVNKSLPKNFYEYFNFTQPYSIYGILEGVISYPIFKSKHKSPLVINVGYKDNQVLVNNVTFKNIDDYLKTVDDYEKKIIIYLFEDSVKLTDQIFGVVKDITNPSFDNIKKQFSFESIENPDDVTKYIPKYHFSDFNKFLLSKNSAKMMKLKRQKLSPLNNLRFDYQGVTFEGKTKMPENLEKWTVHALLNMSPILRSLYYCREIRRPIVYTKKHTVDFTNSKLDEILNKNTEWTNLYNDIKKRNRVDNFVRFLIETKNNIIRTKNTEVTGTSPEPFLSTIIKSSYELLIQALLKDDSETIKLFQDLHKELKKLEKEKLLYGHQSVTTDLTFNDNYIDGFKKQLALQRLILSHNLLHLDRVEENKYLQSQAYQLWNLMSRSLYPLSDQQKLKEAISFILNKNYLREDKLNFYCTKTSVPVVCRHWLHIIYMNMDTTPAPDKDVHSKHLETFTKKEENAYTCKNCGEIIREIDDHYLAFDKKGNVQNSGNVTNNNEYLKTKWVEDIITNAQEIETKERIFKRQILLMMSLLGELMSDSDIKKLYICEEALGALTKKQQVIEDQYKLIEKFKASNVELAQLENMFHESFFTFLVAYFYYYVIKQKISLHIPNDTNIDEAVSSIISFLIKKNKIKLYQFKKTEIFENKKEITYELVNLEKDVETLLKNSKNLKKKVENKSGVSQSDVKLITTEPSIQISADVRGSFSKHVRELLIYQVSLLMKEFKAEFDIENEDKVVTDVLAYCDKNNVFRDFTVDLFTFLHNKNTSYKNALRIEMFSLIVGVIMNVDKKFDETISKDSLKKVMSKYNVFKQKEVTTKIVKGFDVEVVEKLSEIGVYKNEILKLQGDIKQSEEAASQSIEFKEILPLVFDTSLFSPGSPLHGLIQYLETVINTHPEKIVYFQNSILNFYDVQKDSFWKFFGTIKSKHLSIKESSSLMFLSTRNIKKYEPLRLDKEKLQPKTFVISNTVVNYVQVPDLSILNNDKYIRFKVDNKDYFHTLTKIKVLLQKLVMCLANVIRKNDFKPEVIPGSWSLVDNHKKLVKEIKVKYVIDNVKELTDQKILKIKSKIASLREIVVILNQKITENINDASMIEFFQKAVFNIVEDIEPEIFIKAKEHTNREVNFIQDIYEIETIAQKTFLNEERYRIKHREKFEFTKTTKDERKLLAFKQDKLRNFVDVKHQDSYNPTIYG